MIIYLDFRYQLKRLDDRSSFLGQGRASELCGQLKPQGQVNLRGLLMYQAQCLLHAVLNPVCNCRYVRIVGIASPIRETQIALPAANFLHDSA